MSTRDDPRFAFGANWSDYAQEVTEEHVQAAEASLTDLVGRPRNGVDTTFLDVGSGSGIHSVAAARLGFTVTAFDYDIQSVETTRRLVRKFELETQVTVMQGSILDEDFLKSLGPFHLVYSWGVLHHTGNMWRAIDNTLGMACERPSARVVLALYRKTLLCPLWTAEKRWYAEASPRGQAAARRIIGGAWSLSRQVKARIRRGGNQDDHYLENRGMSRDHDLHDWLGGYPYESVDPYELVQHVLARGWSPITAPSPHRGLGSRTGWAGSGCDEYVFAPLNRQDT